jgi:hypothetical protein
MSRRRSDVLQLQADADLKAQDDVTRRFMLLEEEVTRLKNLVCSRCDYVGICQDYGLVFFMSVCAVYMGENSAF